MPNLNEDERSTLAITRYWFENQKKVRAVVTKLVKEFDDKEVSRMTGIPADRVWNYVNVPVRKTSKQAVAVPDTTEIIDHLEEIEEPVSRLTGKMKYVDIASQIIDLIETLDLNPGDNLPTTIELGKKFDVSIATVTRAIDHLKTKGVLTAKRGQRIKVA